MCQSFFFSRVCLFVSKLDLVIWSPNRLFWYGEILEKRWGDFRPFSLTKVICCSFHIVKYNFARREMLRLIASKNINNCTLNNRSMKNLFCSCSILNPQRIKEKNLFFFSFVTSSVLSSKLVLRKKFQKLWSVFIPTCTRGNCYMLISCWLQFLISIRKWERARPCCL